MIRGGVEIVSMLNEKRPGIVLSLEMNGERGGHLSDGEREEGMRG